MTQETILVVDDGKDNRDFIVEYVLEPHNFRYLTAKHGEEGLQLALKHEPDLILLDLQMPRMDGIGMLRAMQEYNLDIPVVLMTFHGSEDVAIEVYRLGVKDYVKKPYYAEEMAAAIDRALSETRLRRERDALTERILHANQELQRRLHEFEVLYKVGKVVTSTIDLDALLPQVVDAAVQITGAEEGYITLIDGNTLTRRAHKVPQLARAKSMHKSVRDSIAQHVIHNHQPILLGPDKLRRTNKRAPLSVICVPLIIGDQELGALSILNHSDSAGIFHEDDITLLNALSDYVAIAIENSRNYHALRASKEKMRDTFERFVAPSVVQQALQEEVELGGERQEISILFADIRGYTAWSEDAPPERVVEMLNHYLSVAGNTIIGWEGTLDKFFGDGLMAIFNAPNPQQDHVHRAAEAALAIQSAAREINAEFGYDLSYSVGVNVGEAVVGYIGTSYAVNYTAIGDAVNLTKRLQEAADPGEILVDEAVYQRLRDRITAELVGDIQIKGRKMPARAYRLLELT